MANPVLTPIPQGVWTKVATNVKNGNLHKKNHTPLYKQTYRLTGDPAPTTPDEAVLMFSKCLSEIIRSDVAIDVYVWCVGADGELRVDL